MPPSTVLAVNKPCARRRHLLRVHFVKLCEGKKVSGAKCLEILVVYLETKCAYAAKLLHFF